MFDLAKKVNRAEAGRTHLFSVGQAGFIIKSADGRLLGIDLYLSECVERVEGHDGYKRLLPQLLAPRDLVFDVLIATHFHRDHYDVDAMADLMDNHKTRLFAAKDCADDVRELGLEEGRAQLVAPGDRCECGGFCIDFINCDHGTGAPEAVGVIVTVDGKRICETGDTCLRTDRRDEYLSRGPLDVLIAPVNGAYGNLNEADCAALAELLRPKLTVPCHYGMFASHGGYPGKFRDLMAEKKLPYRLMTMGEGFALPGGAGKKESAPAKREFEGKKLLILGGNPETSALVRLANDMGVRTIVTSGRHTDDAKKYAWKAFDVDGMDVPGVIALAREEKVDGVLVGVADILVPSYCKVCDALGFPCYATQQIVDVFAFKDVFKSTCEHYGIHGIPEYYLDADMRPEDVAKIRYPVMIKPVDNGGGVGMTVVYDESGLRAGVEKALAASKKKRFIVERYMQCEDMGMYYTFKDGVCSASCIYDRYTTDEQPGLSRVCLGGTYPSKHIKEYFERMHANALRMFREIGIRDGVLMLSAFYENGEFYVYDTGFRLQGEAPHFLIKAIQGFDQREMLIRFALTGSEGDLDLATADDPYLRGKWAATLWFLLKKGRVAKIRGLEHLDKDPRVVENVQRIFEGMEVPEEWIGNEKQVLTRMYLVCDSKEELAEALKEYMEKVRVTDDAGNEMLLRGFDVDRALEL